MGPVDELGEGHIHHAVRVALLQRRGEHPVQAVKHTHAMPLGIAQDSLSPPPFPPYDGMPWGFQVYGRPRQECRQQLVFPLLGGVDNVVIVYEVCRQGINHQSPILGGFVLIVHNFFGIVTYYHVLIVNWFS